MDWYQNYSRFTDENPEVQTDKVNKQIRGGIWVQTQEVSLQNSPGHPLSCTYVSAGL